MKAEHALLACPRCNRWPMVVKDRKGYWSPRRLFRYVCVGCGHRLDDFVSPPIPPRAVIWCLGIRWLSDR